MTIQRVFETLIWNLSLDFSDVALHMVYITESFPTGSALKRLHTAPLIKSVLLPGDVETLTVE